MLRSYGGHILGSALVFSETFAQISHAAVPKKPALPRTQTIASKLAAPVCSDVAFPRKIAPCEAALLLEIRDGGVRVRSRARLKS